MPEIQSRTGLFEPWFHAVQSASTDPAFQVINQRVFKFTHINDQPVLFSIQRGQNGIRYDVHSGADSSNLREFIRRWLSLDVSLHEFQSIAEKDPILNRIEAHFRGLRIVGIPDLFEAICWAIIGQQITVKFACIVKAQVMTQFGQIKTVNDTTVYAFPRPSDIADLSIEKLKEGTQLSRQKAAAMIAVARAMMDGTLDSEALRHMSMNEAEERLTSVRGVGPWTAHYVMMKSLLMNDAFPIQDAGLLNAVKYHLDLDRKPTPAEMIKLGERWRPYRAYATWYLWWSLSQLDKFPNES